MLCNMHTLVPVTFAAGEEKGSWCSYINELDTHNNQFKRDGTILQPQPPNLDSKAEAKLLRSPNQRNQDVQMRRSIS